jgi:hypothetical protein
MKRFAITFTLAVSLAGAQTPTNAGPTLGYLPSIRPWQLQPILGIPGAARLGDPISLPRSVSQLYLAPGQAYAVAAQGPTDPVALVILRSAGASVTTPVLTTLPGAMAAPDLVGFSPTGQSMALYARGTGRIQVFTGLPNSPRQAEEISSSGNVALLAVSDDAQLVLMSDGVGNVYSLARNAAPTPLYHAEEISALVFVPGTHDVIVCDPVGEMAAVVQSVDGVQLIPTPASACQPRAATTSADGKTILLACTSQHLIWSIDRASGLINVHNVSGSPTGFSSLALRDTFTMSPADENGTYWLFTWQAGEPVTSFIGAARLAAQRVFQ